MFTGIVEAVGEILSVIPLGADKNAGVRLQVNAGVLSLEQIHIGDSIALNGACMTVIAKTATEFAVEVSRHSLNHTTGLDAPGSVNLEKAVTLSQPLGGHIVTGHIDGLGIVRQFDAVGESYRLVIEAPRSLARYLAYKGSITINGVSLTVNSVTDTASGCDCSVNLIPHTLQVTTLKHLQPGQRVNLEIDLIARYVERMINVASIEAKQTIAG